MKVRQAVLAGLVVAGFVAAQSVQADPHRLGVGLRYYKTVKAIGEGGDFDKSKLSYAVSYQFAPGLLKLEADWEFLPSVGSSGTVSSPQVYAFLGDMIYGGAGMGWYYADSKFSDDPFYCLRAGVDLPFSNLHIDINANYTFLNSEQFKDFSADFLQFGLAVRYEF